MKLFHDWEFLEDGQRIAPISVGFTATDGREYYAVNRDLPEDDVFDHPWLRGNVVPYLPLAGGILTRHGWLDHSHPDVKPREQIAAEVRDFITKTPGAELWGWYSAFDHVCLAWLYGPMTHLPEGIPMWTNDLRQEAHQLGLTSADMPDQDGREHHALADARHNMLIDAHLDKVRRSRARRRRGLPG